MHLFSLIYSSKFSNLNRKHRDLFYLLKYLETTFTQCFCDGYTDCYTINNVKANWDTANDTCVKQGGIFINDFYDFVYYQINVILQENNGTENYWNGLRRVGNTSQFKWTDGRISNFYDWKSNNPKDGIDCVGVDGESGQLVSLECNTKNNFACRIYLGKLSSI